MLWLSLGGKQTNDVTKASFTKNTMTYHAPFCVKPFGPTRLEVARLLAGGFLQEGTFIGVQDFKDVRILPNTNHLPLLGPTPTLDGTLEKHQKGMRVT